MSLYCCCKVLFDCTLQPWGSTIWSQHTDTMLHWCMPLALLKLQVLLRKEFLQCGHILSPRMFKSWDRSSAQTSCAGVFFSLCLSLSLPCFFLFFPHTAFFLCLRPLPPTRSAEGIKYSINNSILMYYKTLSACITGVIPLLDNHGKKQCLGQNAYSVRSRFSNISQMLKQK